MFKGYLTGRYETHHEFRGIGPIPVPAKKAGKWVTQIEITPGTWFVEAFTYFELRNVSFKLQLEADNKTYFGNSAVHNTNSKEILHTVSLLSLLDDVQIKSSKPQVLTITLFGGAGGGEYANTGLVLKAWEKK